MSSILFDYTHPGESRPSIAVIETLGCLSIAVRGDAPFASSEGSSTVVLLTDAAVEDLCRSLNAEMAKRTRQKRETKPKVVA